MTKLEIKRCKNLLDDFISGRISAKEFEKKYLTMRREWGNKKILFTPDEDSVLADIFTAVDMYEDDSVLREEHNKEESRPELRCIDEDQLLMIIKKEKNRLEYFSTQS